MSIGKGEKLYMKDSTKNRILECACRLFKEYGYNAVSMRNIADALDISVGNLTYHFRKKEDLIEALIFEEMDSYRDFSGKLRNVEELDCYFRHLLDVQSRLSFYFDSYNQLSQISDVLRHKQIQMIDVLSESLRSCLDVLLDSGLLRRDVNREQYEIVVKIVVMLLLYRIPGEERRLCSDDGEKTIKTIWSFLLPYLTDEGLAKIDAVVAKAQEAARSGCP